LRSLRNWKSKYYWQQIAFISSLLIILFVIAKFLSHPKPAESTEKYVETESVSLQNIQQTIRLLGTIHPTHATILTAKGAGLLDTLVPTSQKVKKGTLIAKIDNLDTENNLQLSAKAEDLAKLQLDRFQPLLKTGFVSAKEVEEKKQAWIIAQKELSHTKIELDNLRFYAPFDGIVGAYKKREGAQVGLGEAVVTIYDPSSLVVDFDIPCGNLTTINEGQSLKVLGKSYKLTHLQKMLDEDTHMCPADVNIQCDDCLIGSTVDVDLVIAEKKQVIVIPFQAVFLRNSKPFVYTVENDKVALISIETGLHQQETIEVTAGLKSGQQIIVKGQDRLYPEMPVKIYRNANPQVASS